jgi:hypothetical protein
MPEALNKSAIQAMMNNPADQTGYGLASSPTAAYDQPAMVPASGESIFHPVRAVEDIIGAINRLYSQLSLLVQENERQRTFKDVPVQIGGSYISYTLDYQERKYLYALAGSALTLVPSTGGTIALTANVWSSISLPRGTTLTIQGGSDAAPATVWIRACDFQL